MFRKVLYIAALFFFTGVVSAQNTVIELFTSQGCSSCPPADELVAKVQERYGAEVITLSYHVDYWDYIGWKDPFGSKAFTQKQYDYATVFGLKGVYTPQAVINGNSHFTGSDSRKMSDALQENIIENKTSIQLGEIKKGASKLWVPYTLADIAKNDHITFALTVKERTTAIKRGENRNRILTNHNIVVDQVSLDIEQEGSVQLDIPEWITPTDQLSIVAYVSKNRVGITSATKKNVLGSTLSRN